MTDHATVEAATQAITAGSKSFAAAARLFAPAMRESAVMLYAWCRHCDDVVDGQELGFRGRDHDREGARERLVLLEEQTRATLRGEPPGEPAFAGLGEVVRRHGIPERYPFEHLDGFRMDVDERRYETIGDTLDYAYHVAGVVGVMMAYVMGVRDPAILARATDLGLAFQLTNIARDIVEDARAGRVYLPAAWLREQALPTDAAALAECPDRDGLASVAARLVDEAEPLYASAVIGIRALPLRAAWAIATAHGVYREIGIEVVRRRAHAWDTRVSTSRAAKVRHVAMGAAAALAGRLRSGS